jgi:hypothetical protein
LEAGKIIEEYVEEKMENMNQKDESYGCGIETEMEKSLEVDKEVKLILKPISELKQTEEREILGQLKLKDLTVNDGENEFIRWIRSWNRLSDDRSKPRDIELKNVMDTKSNEEMKLSDGCIPRNLEEEFIKWLRPWGNG